jgi:hypothetical protein
MILFIQNKSEFRKSDDAASVLNSKKVLLVIFLLIGNSMFLIIYIDNTQTSSHSNAYNLERITMLVGENVLNYIT